MTNNTQKVRTNVFVFDGFFCFAEIVNIKQSELGPSVYFSSTKKEARPANESVAKFILLVLRSVAENIPHESHNKNAKNRRK
jgi:hypothetical protein